MSRTDKCGTLVGYREHLARKDKPCPKCREANTKDQRQRREAARNGTANVLIPFWVLKELYFAAPPEIRHRVKQSIRELINRDDFKAYWRNEPVVPGKHTDSTKAWENEYDE